jgi:hypothetical protein
MRFNVSVLDLLASIDAMTPAVRATGGVVPAVRVRELPLVTGVAA